MTDRLRLDGRRETALREEMLRRAAATLSGDGQERSPGEVASALIGVTARIGEEVTRRLDRVPAKQADNLFSAMGIGRDPARPARVPVAFRLADPAPDGLVAPAGTRLMGPGEAGAVAFETRSPIALARGEIVALVAVDAEKDQIFLPPASVVHPAIPGEPAVERALISGGGPGADKLQISLAGGLPPGTILRLGTGPEAAEHRVVEVDNDLVAIDPPLDRTFGSGAPVTVAADFTTFAGHRDRQAHALYLGHDTLLNLPSALSIVVTGLNLPEDTEWSWWGGDDPPRWHALVASTDGSRVVLAKGEGQPAPAELRGRESYWVRARLRGGSGGPSEARDIRLSVGGSSGSAEASGLEAIANMTPLVLNSAFHPFGREPRLYDSFYIGCAEAFSKPNAEVSLRFEFAGPALGPLAMVASGGLVQVFSVGEDRLLYRAQFGRGQPRLLSIDLRRGKGQAASPPPRAAVAARMIGKRVLLAVAGMDRVYFADLPFEEPVDAASVEWKVLASENDRGTIGRVAIVEDEGKAVVLAQAGQSVLSWTDPAASPAPDVRSGELVAVQGAEAALVIGPPEAGSRPVTLIGGMEAVTGTNLPDFDLAAWAAYSNDPEAPPGIVYLAGYQAGSGKAPLRVVRIDMVSGVTEVVATVEANQLPGQAGVVPERWPIALQPPPPPIFEPGETPPTLALASPTPTRFVWDGDGYRPVASSPSLGASDNPHRHFAGASGWLAVHHGNLGLLYRPGAESGEWTEEYLLSAMPDPLELVENVPRSPLYAAPTWGPLGDGFSILRSELDASALLRPSPGPRKPSTACFFADSATPEGQLQVEGNRVRLVDDAAFGRWEVSQKEADRLAGLAADAETALVPLRAEAVAAAGKVTLAEQSYQREEKALTAAKTKADAARKKVTEAESELLPLTTARIKAEADLAALKAQADPPAKDEAIKKAEDGVASAKAAESAAQTKLAAAKLDATAPVAAEVAAQTKRDSSRGEWDTRNAEAETLRGQVEAAEGELRTKQGQRDGAVQQAESLASYSVPVVGDEVDVRAFAAGQAQDPRELWHFSRSGDPQWWGRPARFPPTALAGKALRYKILQREEERPVGPATVIPHPEQLETRIAELGTARPLSFHGEPNRPLPPLRRFKEPGGDEIAILTVPPHLFSGNSRSALLTTATEEWRSLGPAQPPNPALSWEYWNGSSWWALDGAKLIDGTANLLVDGTISFTVPADIAATEVGGRENHWIRARLVGGDFGEAQVAVRTVPGAGGESRQIVERDMSTIRAPYVTSLKLGFCARDEVPPQFILTEDSLGAVDQAAANLAGLPVRLFAPVRDLMGAGAVSRAVMIGLSKPVRGDPVSLYVDVAPGGIAATLIAEIHRDGRFERIQMRDETRGLSEPGMILLSLQRAPDQAELFGTAAHWVRLSPSETADGWVPRLRGLHLNAAFADSVETRELESLGHSSGIPKQLFRLAGAPVDVGSLDLRVAEPLGEEDLLSGTLDVVATAGAKVAHWVRWSEVEDLSAADGRARVFLLDPETGLIQFGDGRRGAIPPLGAELLARLYRCVAGEAGNLVAPGAALQIVSPVASVERVTALDAAAGGSDAETIEQARRRGTAKLRHGNRIVTLADLEDYVRACSPAVAQARATNRGGRVRLVVAATGAEPRPGPAMLRALKRSLQSAAAYGVARYGGVDVAAPRLLPLRVKLTLEPDDPEMYVAMAQAAEAHLGKLFDAATGGFDGQGWPIGRAPTPGDIAAALEPVSRFGVASVEALERADRRGAEAFPAAIPDDVLVWLEPDDLICERRTEKAA